MLKDLFQEVCMMCRVSQWSVCFGIVLWCFTSPRDCETPYALSRRLSMSERFKVLDDSKEEKKKKIKNKKRVWERKAGPDLHPQITWA